MMRRRRSSFPPAKRLDAILALGTVLLLLNALSPVAAASSECRCHDAPDAPCIRQWLELVSIEFPYEVWTGNRWEESVFHDRLDEAGDSELWVLIQVVPLGPCRSDCQQIYVWYAPNLDVAGRDFALRPSGVDDVVFSMLECDPRHDCQIRIALIEEDESYADAMTRALFWVPRSMMMSEQGARNPWTLGAAGWSLRAEAATDNAIDLVFAKLMQDTSNDNIIGIRAVDCPVFAGGLSTTRRIENTTGPGWVDVTFRRFAEEIPCDLACSPQQAAAPTQAEQHLKAQTLEDAARTAAAAPAGHHVAASGVVGVPANAVSRSTLVSSTSHTSLGGTVSRFVRRLIVIRFEDDSVYVYLEEEKTARDASGGIVSRTRSRGDGASRAGAERSSVRGELVDASLRGATYRGWGSLGQTPYIVAAPPPLASFAPGLGRLMYDEIEWTVPAGEGLDLTGAVGASAAEAVNPLAVALGVAAGIAADQSITLHADTLILPDGVSLEQTMTPAPQQLPGVDEILIPTLPEAGISVGEGSLAIPLVCLSGDPQEMTAVWADERGWTAPGSQVLTLGAGEMGWLDVPYWIDADAARVGEGSRFTLDVTSDKLGTQTMTIDLLLGAPTEPGDAGPPETVAAPSVADSETPADNREAGIPREVIDCVEQIGTASGTDYKNSGLRNYRVPVSQRVSFFEDELEVYDGCPVQGACVEIVLDFMAIADASEKSELAAIFWDAFHAANR
ncbi:MAG: hypothetical protein JXB13_05385 [Phycisphaerae bacterium]|nr:hypothetical protein [Phycisphaerae bacterium]